MDLATSFANTTPVTVSPGKGSSVIIDIENVGNVTADGTLNLSLYASTTGLIDASSTLLASISNKKIKLAAGKTLKIHLSFKALADLTGGNYSLIATASSSTTPADTDTADKTATIATPGVSLSDTGGGRARNGIGTRILHDPPVMAGGGRSTRFGS